MSNYYTGYANGSMNPFKGEIKQEPVKGREDGIVFPEGDKGRNIMEYDVFGKESEDAPETRLHKVQMTFLKDVGRYEQSGEEDLEDKLRK